MTNITPTVIKIKIDNKYKSNYIILTVILKNNTEPNTHAKKQNLLTQSQNWLKNWSRSETSRKEKNKTQCFHSLPFIICPYPVDSQSERDFTKYMFLYQHSNQPIRIEGSFSGNIGLHTRAVAVN